MNFEEFTQLDHIRHFYSRFYLKSLGINERLIVMTVSDLQSSLNRLYLKTGLMLDPAVHSNRSIYTNDSGHFRGRFAEDTQLYDQLIALQQEA